MFHLDTCQTSANLGVDSLGRELKRETRKVKANEIHGFLAVILPTFVIVSSSSLLLLFFLLL